MPRPRISRWLVLLMAWLSLATWLLVAIPGSDAAKTAVSQESKGHEQTRQNAHSNEKYEDERLVDEKSDDTPMLHLHDIAGSKKQAQPDHHAAKTGNKKQHHHHHAVAGGSGGNKALHGKDGKKIQHPQEEIRDNKGKKKGGAKKNHSHHPPGHHKNHKHHQPGGKDHGHHPHPHPHPHHHHGEIDKFLVLVCNNTIICSKVCHRTDDGGSACHDEDFPMPVIDRAASPVRLISQENEHYPGFDHHRYGFHQDRDGIHPSQNWVHRKRSLGFGGWRHPFRPDNQDFDDDDEDYSGIAEESMANLIKRAAQEYDIDNSDVYQESLQDKHRRIQVQRKMQQHQQQQQHGKQGRRQRHNAPGAVAPGTKKNKQKQRTFTWTPAQGRDEKLAKMFKKHKLDSRTIIIRLDGPCPKPCKHDVPLSKLLTNVQDLEQTAFQVDSFSAQESAPDAVVRHNGAGDGGDGHDIDCNDIFGKCTAKGVFCGSSLFGCNFKDNAIYKCDHRGDKPVLVEDCSDIHGQCFEPFGKNRSAICIPPPCRCKEEGKICGSSFPEFCGYNPDAVFYCNATGSRPIFVDGCTPGTCVADTDSCLGPECECKFPGPICGSTFNASCGYDPDILYECGASGEKPCIVRQCRPGTCHAGARSCEATLCKCPKPRSSDITNSTIILDKSLVCGRDFPKACHLAPNTLYTCAGEGTEPIPIEECHLPDSVCVSGLDHCLQLPNFTHPNCTCDSTGLVCGSEFPTGCLLDHDTLYTCTGNGSVPVPNKKCLPNTCFGGVQDCLGPECACPASGLYCGGYFNASCGFDPDVLYSCTTTGAMPFPARQCDDGACPPDGNTCTPTDCRCSTNGTICGSDLIISGTNNCSELDPNILYNCPHAGDEPVPIIECPEECVSGTGACKVDPTPPDNGCKCNETNATYCGSSFDPSCGFNPNELYYCSRPGQDPFPFWTCIPGTCDQDKRQCTVPNCECTTEGLVCGSDFPRTCLLNPNVLYHCDYIGGDPYPAKECIPGTCTMNNSTVVAEANGTCIDAMCRCMGAGLYCGSYFNDDCPFEDDVIYACYAPGAVPSPVRQCKDGTCTNGDINSCIATPCHCNSTGTVCGSDFPAECFFNPNIIYTCGGNGTEPLPIKQCLIGTCETGSDTCRPPPVCPVNRTCLCPSGSDDSTICGSSFPASCGLNPDMLYTCGSSGDMPYPEEQCIEGTCIRDSSTCLPLTCACLDIGLICGSFYNDTNCPWDADILFRCTETGTIPTPVRQCIPGTCIQGNDPCDATDCKCTGSGTYCGHSFPLHCGFDKDELYNCAGNGSEPIPIQKCRPGQCQDGLPTCKDFILPDECVCKGKGMTCGTSFPAYCHYIPDELYYCTGNGSIPYPVLTCLDGTCSNGTNTCESVDCLCEEAGLTCGSTFPRICGLNPDVLYNCRTPGTKPIPIELCIHGTCQSGSDTCANTTCQCQASGLYCGSSFDPSCGLEDDILYGCLNAGSVPYPVRQCADGTCNAADPGSCVGTKCKCDGNGTVCGSSFPDICQFPDDILYSCAGNGSEPVPIAVCQPGQCVDGEDSCVVPPGPDDGCLCKDKVNRICGGDLNRTCGFSPDVVYICRANGSVPYPIAQCEPGTCVNGTCPIIGCMCQKTGKICGSTFPDNCGYDDNVVYQCTRGKAPVPIEVCPDGTCSPGTGYCQNDTVCACPNRGFHCGTYFDDSCQFDDNTIYFCPGVNATPVPETVCPADTCKEGSPFCTVIPRCRCNDTGTICGSTFPKYCRYDKDALYYCAGNGSVPQYIETCDKNTCPANGTSCVGPQGCDCQASGTYCGTNFPAGCGYDPNALYYCARNGSIPIKVVTCPTPGTCLINTGTCNNNTDCICNSTGLVCGSSYPADCNLDPDTLYACPDNSSIQIPVHKCQPGTCNSATGRCDKNDCVCIFTGNICGSTLNRMGCTTADPATIYYCVKGEDPVEVEDCAPQSCQSTTAPDGSITVECTSDPCVCASTGSTCSDQFDASCGLKPNTSYICTNGTAPVEEQECVAGCNDVTGQCNADCICDPNDALNPDLVCSSALPSTCLGLSDKVLYFCQPGQEPVPILQCGQQCVVNATGFDYCPREKCPCDGQTGLQCGSRFNESCGLDNGTLYACGDGTGFPVQVKNCTPAACIENDAMEDMCDHSTCSCEDRGLYCGSDFPPDCATNNNTLYFCVAPGTVPVPFKICEGMDCQNKNGSCAGPFNCNCTGTGTICGSALPPECDLDPDILYVCPTPGTPYIPTQSCFPGTCDNDTLTCQPIDCACNDTTAGLICGSTFDVYCGYNPDTIYFCPTLSNHSTLPIPVKKCLAGTCAPGTSTCQTCECITPGPICGSTFPPECGRDPDTLYICTNGSTVTFPYKKCIPGTCPVNGTSCETNPCTCTKDQLICGWELVENGCTDADPNSIYNCSTGDLPTSIESCDPTQCLESNNTAFCTPDPCKCYDVGHVCGSHFPPSCGLNNSVSYNCAADGATPMPIEDCSPSYCNPNTGDCLSPCVCTNNNLTCGSEFTDCPSVDPNSLYLCTFGQLPVLVRECIGVCIPNPNGDDSCPTPGCTCGNDAPKGLYCGSQLDNPLCPQFDDNSLYACVSPDSPPVLVEDCSSNICINGTAVPPAISNSTCLFDNCTCVGAGIFCGTTFPDSCLMDDDTLYRCSGPGSIPIPVAKCVPGACQIQALDGCVLINCTCVQAGEVCGSSFDDSCGLPDYEGYSCEDSGAIPVPILNCSDTQCLTVNDEAFCAPVIPDPCKCLTDNATVCGRTFPDKCGLIPDTIYDCSAGTGTDPIPGDSCLPQTCFNGSCWVDPCQCVTAGTVCGFVFPDACGLDDDTIYVCSGFGKDPDPSGTICKDGCYQIADSAQCVLNCNCTTTGLVCGSAFDTGCGYSADTLYTCTNGNAPVPAEVCEVGKCNVDHCDVDPCLCTVTGTFCGGDFDVSCGFTVNATYTCSATGVRPNKKDDCPNGCKDGACLPDDPCDCLITGTVCGGDFDVSCGLAVNSTYTCTDGSLPVNPTDCPFGCENGACVDPCICTVTGTFCGGDFDVSCGFDPSTIYECSETGNFPTNPIHCQNGCQDGSCIPPDPCLCIITGTICGGDIDASCELDPNSLYTCTDGTLPTNPINCSNGCQNGNCIPPDPCVCNITGTVCGGDFDVTCGLNANSVYTCTDGSLPTNPTVCPNGCTNGACVDPCLCTVTGTVCSADFDASCGLTADSVYTCTIGVRPTTPTTCPNGCKDGACIPSGDCVCTEYGPFCGDELNCPGLDPDGYYSCLIGQPPFQIGVCDGGNPTSADCLCADDIPECTSYWPMECGYKPDNVFSCPGAGEKPVMEEQCGFGKCSRTSGAEVVCVMGCTCDTVGVFCGDWWDPSCALDSSTTYTCSAIGGTPIPTTNCGQGLCSNNGNTGKCLQPCQCTNYQPVCGAYYPASCGFDKSTLYQCDYEGAMPVRPQTCAIPCGVQFGPDRCGKSYS